MYVLAATATVPSPALPTLAVSPGPALSPLLAGFFRNCPPFPLPALPSLPYHPLGLTETDQCARYWWSSPLVSPK